MARNWTIKEAIEVLENGTEIDAITDIGRRCPLFVYFYHKSPQTIIKAIGRNISAKNANKRIDEFFQPESIEEEVEHEEEIEEVEEVKEVKKEKVKKTKKEKVKEKIKEEDDEDIDDDNIDDDDDDDNDEEELEDEVDDEEEVKKTKKEKVKEEDDDLNFDVEDLLED